MTREARCDNFKRRILGFPVPGRFSRQRNQESCASVYSVLSSRPQVPGAVLQELHPRTKDDPFEENHDLSSTWGVPVGLGH